jgi:hypothetical protein
MSARRHSGRARIVTVSSQKVQEGRASAAVGEQARPSGPASSRPGSEDRAVTLIVPESLGLRHDETGTVRHRGLRQNQGPRELPPEKDLRAPEPETKKPA